MGELHQLVKQYIEKKCRPINKGDNYNMKQFVMRFNSTLMGMAQGIQGQKSISINSVKQFLMHHYLLSDRAIKGDIERIIASKVFHYDEATETFTLPEEYQRMIEETQDDGHK